MHVLRPRVNPPGASQLGGEQIQGYGKGIRSPKGDEGHKKKHYIYVLDFLG